MKTVLFFFVLVFSSALSAIENEGDERFIFFLHNRFLEDNALTVRHPEFGNVQYKEVLSAFREQGFTVLSEKRKGNVFPKTYALKVRDQIDSLMATGVAANHITVVGTSKGGYIAQYVSTFAKNPDLNFVFIGCYMEDDIQFMPDINFCGNILTIYESSDPSGVSAVGRKEASTCSIKHFKEIELDTGMRHGFLFRALKEWIDPAVAWANGDYGSE
jgi:hypothetical protein